MKILSVCLIVAAIVLALNTQQVTAIFFGKGGLGGGGGGGGGGSGGAKNSETYYAQPLKKYTPPRRAPSVQTYKVILKSAPKPHHVQTFKVIHLDKSNSGYGSGGCHKKW